MSPKSGEVLEKDHVLGKTRVVLQRGGEGERGRERGRRENEKRASGKELMNFSGFTPNST